MVPRPGISSTVRAFLVLLIGTQILGAGEKVGTTSFQFLKLSLDARSSALGEAATAIGTTSETVFHNPAGLVRTTGVDVATSYVDYFLDVNLFSFSASIPLSPSQALGLFAIYADYGTVEVTDAAHLYFNSDWSYNPGLTGETLHPSASAFGLSYAQSVTDKLTFGLTAKYIRENLVMAKASVISFDGGLDYDTHWRSLRFGAAIRNFGPDVTFLQESFPVPETFTVGVSAYLFSPGMFLVSETSSQSLLFSYDISHPRDYGQQHHLGLEYSLLNMLFLRGGYKLNFDEEGLTYGVGVRYGGFRVDYAYDRFGTVLPSVHRISVGYVFP